MARNAGCARSSRPEPLPTPAFNIKPVPGTTVSKGFYLLIAQPSPFRPHAVVAGDGLRYPRRDGSTTRYLSEIEVADKYRGRFRGEREQLDRLDRIGREALDRVKKDGPWLVAALVPNSAGAMSISFRGAPRLSSGLGRNTALLTPRRLLRAGRATGGWSRGGAVHDRDCVRPRKARRTCIR